MLPNPMMLMAVGAMEIVGAAVKAATGRPVGLPDVGKGVGAVLQLGFQLKLGLALGNFSITTVSTVTLCPS